MTDSNATELLPCPFCGRRATIHSWWSSDEECGKANVGCSRESYSNGYECARIFIMRCDEKTARRDAMRIWNKRTPEQAVAATLGAGECEWQMAVGEGFCEGHVWRNDDGEREQEPFGVASHILSCGHTVLMKNDRGDNTPIPNFCSYCGKAVNR